MEKLIDKATAVIFFLIGFSALALSIYHSYHWGSMVVFGLISVFAFIASWVVNEEAKEI